MSEESKYTIEELERHLEDDHYSHKLGWLRAAVLGANDGIISVSSVLVGVIASGIGMDNVIIVGLATLVAGIFAMSAGEYISVSSQADTEKADLEIERKRIEENWEGELLELAVVYQQRGVSKETSLKVARELMEYNPLEAHARDELGLHEIHSANPLQAAFASGLAFFLGGVFPILFVLLFPQENLGWTVSLGSIILLTILGALASKVGGSSPVVGGFRVAVWGSLAMAVTTMVGFYFDAFH